MSESLAGKNRITTDGTRYLFVEAPDVGVAAIRQGLTRWVTCSIQDYDLVSEHRWRVRDGAVMTTIHTSSHTLMTMLFNAATEPQMVPVDGNAFNFSRDNLKLGRGAKTNELLVSGNTVYITLPNAQVAVIDAEEQDTVSRYYWKIHSVRGQPMVRTVCRSEGESTKVALTRLITGYKGARAIRFRNNDPLDCRKANLWVEGDDMYGKKNAQGERVW